MHKVVNAQNAFKLNEFRDTYELVGGNENDGTFYMNWAIASTYDSKAEHSVPVTKDDGKYMNVPVKVVLGSKEQAIENLKWLLGELEGHEVTLPVDSNGQGPVPENDVPF